MALGVTAQGLSSPWWIWGPGDEVLEIGADLDLKLETQSVFLVD
jgi:hypothetical protein